MNKTRNFTSSVALKTYKINPRLNWDDKCFIYLLACNKCFKQYAGETTEIFSKSWNNCKNNVRKFLRRKICMQQHLFERFQSPGQTGFIDDVSVTLIDKADPFIPTKYEDYWRQTLKTLVPQTLKKASNVLDYIWYFCPDFSSHTLFQTAVIRTTIFWIYTVVTW